MIELAQHRDGVVLPIKAQPGARQNAITGAHGGALKVAVTAPPEKGKANRAIRQLLSASLDIKNSQIQWLAGETSSQKKLLIRDVPLTELARRLQVLLSAK